MRLKSYKNLSISCFSFFLNYAFVITIIPTSTLLSVSFHWWFFLIFWLNGLPLAQDKISARYSNDMTFFKQEEDYNFLLKKVTKLNLFSISHRSERKLQQLRRVGKVPGLLDERQETVGETMLGY